MLPRILHFTKGDQEYIVIQTEDCNPREYAKPGFELRNTVVLSVDVDVSRLPCDRSLVSDG